MPDSEYAKTTLFPLDRPRGPTDKASDYESGDSRFQFWRGRYLLFFFLLDIDYPLLFRKILFQMWILTSWLKGHPSTRATQRETIFLHFLTKLGGLLA